MRSNRVSDPRSRRPGTVARRQRRRCWPTVMMLEDRRLLSTIVVNNPTDTFVAGQIDLRDAIAQANASGGDQTITFDPTVFATPQTITLGVGQLELSDTTGTETITGPAAGVTVNANNASRVFQVDRLVTASISGLTISGGNFAIGGGMFNLGTATLTNCTVSGNSATRLQGGGVFNYGTATLTDCTISGNSATAFYGNGGGYGRRSWPWRTANCCPPGP